MTRADNLTRMAIYSTGGKRKLNRNILTEQSASSPNTAITLCRSWVTWWSMVSQLRGKMLLTMEASNKRTMHTSPGQPLTLRSRAFLVSASPSPSCSGLAGPGSGAQSTGPRRSGSGSSPGSTPLTCSGFKDPSQIWKNLQKTSNVQ